MIIVIITFCTFRIVNSTNLLMLGTTLCDAVPVQKYHIFTQLYHYPLVVDRDACFFPSPLLYSAHRTCYCSYYLPFEADEAEK